MVIKKNNYPSILRYLITLIGLAQLLQLNLKADMKKQEFIVTYKNKIYNCFIDEEGMVWFYDSLGFQTNYGQVSPIYEINIAKEAVITMLSCSGL